MSTIIRDDVTITLRTDATGYSGHSLRAGHVTELTARGVDQRLIMRQTGHRDPRMMAVYDRPADLFNDHPLQTSGWW